MTAGQLLNLGSANLQIVLSYFPAYSDKFFIIVNGTNATSSIFNGMPQGSQISLGSYNGFAYTGYISYTGNVGTNSITGGNDVVIYNPLPEPSSFLALAGVGGLGFLIRRKRRAAQVVAC
jgi:hypothetical protein